MSAPSHQSIHQTKHHANGQPVQLRPASSADLPEILRIQALCYPSILPEDEAAYINKLQEAPDCAFVIQAAAENSRLQAYLFALPILADAPPVLNSSGYRRLAAANCLYLHDLAIDPAARGLGLSAPLLQTFFAAAQQLALPQCSLIAIQNSSAFWQRYGFGLQPLSHSAAIQAKLATYGQAEYLLRYLNTENKQ